MHLEFCRRLRLRERLLGTIVSVDAIAVMEVIAGCGFDWIFVEAEHAPNDVASLERLITAAGSTPCLVRLPTHEPIWIKRALDLGAAGIIVPQVNTVDEAQAIAAAARFTPAGNRGLGVCRANNYGYAAAEYIETANEATAVIVQAEDRDAVKNAAAIAAVDGIDGVLIGPFDLSASLGLPGQIDHEDVRAAIAEIYAGFNASGKSAGFFSPDPTLARVQMEQGFNLVACSADVMLLRQSAAALLDELRASG